MNDTYRANFFGSLKKPLNTFIIIDILMVFQVVLV